MKKFILSLILAVAVIFSCMCPAFADSAWVLNKDAESITHDGTTYLPVHDMKNYRFTIANDYFAYLEYADEETRENYGGGYISTYYDRADVIEVQLAGHYTTIFVSEAYMTEFQKLRDGECDYYEIENGYGIVSLLDYEDYSDITAKSAVAFSNVSEANFLWLDLYATGDKGFACGVGAVVKEKETGDLYILRFSDYDSSYFYADGTFARYKNVTLYAIDNEDVAYNIDQLINTRPDDELDWLVGKEPSKTQKIVSAIVFFIVIPVGIIAFCVIMLVRAKKKMYRCPLIVLMSAAALLLISALIVFI